MVTYAAVMTGKGTGAISVIQLYGGDAKAIINKIFKPKGAKPSNLESGKIMLGMIADANETVDQVTVGCEGPDKLAINCHGNPLIVSAIMQLLEHAGAKPITAEQLLAKILIADKHANTIKVEAKLTQLRAETIQGIKIIENQIIFGLSKRLTDWLENIDTIPLEQITGETEQILTDSRKAKLIIFGSKVAIVGPPNTGKSTLLNCLSGRQKAIVTEIKGTTRDWVSARCQIGHVSMEIFDTAGLDEKLATAAETSIDRAAQEKSVQILEQADLILLVLDINQPTEQLDECLLDRLVCKDVLTVLNKVDLPAKFDAARLPEALGRTVQISAKFGTSIPQLVEKMLLIFGVANFDVKVPVCFTARQMNLLTQLTHAKSKQKATILITNLLYGELI
jgi:tRNA modification GTPase